VLIATFRVLAVLSNTCTHSPDILLADLYFVSSEVMAENRNYYLSVIVVVYRFSSVMPNSFLKEQQHVLDPLCCFALVTIT